MANLDKEFIKVQPQVKEQAEAILEKIGFSMTNAVEIFLKQVILQKGMPLDFKLHYDKPLSVEDLTQDELDAILEESITDCKNGNVLTENEVDEYFKRNYNIWLGKCNIAREH